MSIFDSVRNNQRVGRYDSAPTAAATVSRQYGDARNDLRGQVSNIASQAARQGVSRAAALRAAGVSSMNGLAGLERDGANAYVAARAQDQAAEAARAAAADQRTRADFGMGLNIGGQVLGTALNAFAPGAGSAVGAASGAIGQQVAAPQSSAAQMDPNYVVYNGSAALSATPSIAQQAATPMQPAAQPAPSQVVQPTPQYTAPNAAGGVPSGAQSLTMPTATEQAVQLSNNGQYIPRDLIPQRAPNVNRRRAR